MSAQDAENHSNDHYESGERAEESIPPWLDEAEIIAREYRDDDPWIDEG